MILSAFGFRMVEVPTGVFRQHFGAKRINLLILNLTFSVLTAQTTQAQGALSGLDHHYFIENKGQWPADVLYLSRLGGLEFWITRYGMNLNFIQRRELSSPEGRENESRPRIFEERDYEVLGHRVLVRLVGHNPNPTVENAEKLPGYHNYLLGNDPRKHASFVGLYRKVWVKGVYPGVDMRYYFEDGRIRYDWVLAPGVDPGVIRFVVEGADKVAVRDGKQLLFETRFGEVGLVKLKVYQAEDGREVTSCFAWGGDSWGVGVGAYDCRQGLVIDPLVYSTYLGGSGLDEGRSITVDGNGHAYITGETVSSNYDTTPGAFQSTNGGSYDVFITKLNPLGTALVYSTYIGGSQMDEGRGIAVDGSGNAYATGYTQSADYDITPGAFQTTHAGGADVFVTKLDPSGAALVYSTYIGGSSSDIGYSIAIDGGGNAYITGRTESTDYDVTLGAFQTTHGGGADAFVTKLNPSGTALVYSTYIGGSSNEIGNGIASDASGNAYITGETRSSDFDVTPGAFQTTHAGNADVFVTKLNPSGAALVYSTYIGGASSEYGHGIALDGTGSAYITGVTWSSDFDVTPGAFQTTYAGSIDAFVTKLNPLGTALLYSTYIGGSNEDRGWGVAVDGGGRVYVVGGTRSSDFDVTPGAFQTSFSGGTCGNAACEDVFVTKLNETWDGLAYSTYLGGNSNDVGRGIALDGSGYAYVTGRVESSDFDVTPGALHTVFGGVRDIFVTKLSLGGSTGSITQGEIGGDLAWRVSPNPTDGYFVIVGKAGMRFELVDGTGRVVRQYALVGSELRVVEDVTGGLYIVREVESGLGVRLNIMR